MRDRGRVAIPLRLGGGARRVLRDSGSRTLTLTVAFRLRTGRAEVLTGTVALRGR